MLGAPLLGAPVGRPANLLYVVVDQLSGLAIPGEDPLARMPNFAGLPRKGSDSRMPTRRA